MYQRARLSSFKKVSRWARPTSFVLAIAFLGAGSWLALKGSPADYQQGETVRIMYVHVPASWFALGVYVFMALSALVGFVWKHPLADISAKAAAPIGLTLTAISLATGSLWGKPMWGAWWVWDARLTSMLVLFFLYVGYMSLISSCDDPAKGLKLGNVLLILGLINIPIIKFSVEWWHTLHQPASVFKSGGSSIHSSMLIPLFTMASGYVMLISGIWFIRMENEFLRRKIRSLKLSEWAREHYDDRPPCSEKESCDIKEAG
tara:strand:+ start:3749 stop:4531 length:783 start_codon:yes stop_codon:yes gene_type:complete